MSVDAMIAVFCAAIGFVAGVVLTDNIWRNRAINELHATLRAWDRRKEEITRRW
jgi:hypothetical protein